MFPPINSTRIFRRDPQLDLIPIELGDRSNPQESGLNANQLSEIPPELVNLPNLTPLFGGNQPISIRTAFGHPVNPQEAGLRDDFPLSEIPPELVNLPNLTPLFLR